LPHFEVNFKQGAGFRGMQTIVWDVDDVLNDLMLQWFEHKWLPEHASCPVTYEMLKQNPPHEILGVSLEEYLRSLDSFRFSEMGKQLIPSEEIICWFRRHGHRYRHIALTATPMQCASNSAAWVFRHFGEWIRSYGFVPSKRDSDPPTRYDETKADYLRWLKCGDILVDDKPIDVETVRQLKMRVLLVPRPWNAAGGSLEDVLHSLGDL
jgi:hypothetical protein